MPMPNEDDLPSGLRAAAVQCGIRARKNCLDLGLLVTDEARPAAAIYTKSLLLGAHVSVCRDHLSRSGGLVRAVLVNSGNANCSTGTAGIEDNRRVCAALAELIGCPPEQVLFLSTGVIGERLPVDRVMDALPLLTSADAQHGGHAFAQSILTTDLVPKIVRRELPGGSQVVGIAKGSGMIHPNMATMFGFLLTDAPLGNEPLKLLRQVNDRSFQRLTVDGDTSPNDTVLLWSTAADQGAPRDPQLAVVLEDVAERLARKIAVDGEGATRLVTVRVMGAPDEEAAVVVGRTIATSPLTKTAVHGRDPNWGRILAAAARSGVAFDPAQARVTIGRAEVYAKGRPQPENEGEAHRHMLEDKEILLAIDLAAGPAEADVWTCDLSADYVRINADYRT
ncbi:bifunctional glutamate N-acetyltransferase/amino-acid acetyltransferase ArgJ [Engelhardtia mirabilis]|uniref:Arginine biosynthesis bifunctional protein ArgJ n=1 Tax=Engelhardtia mirabilis TaxID=2528011 RepID=A0A518BQ01_9BACT|nr:Arginine biosynthesis bifunctional protein ArgJ [Planctomycetes bacterium Pla133]QDV03381.1 Arginine biosynthesis bifunctional protein ArgJ [Planctomycetes bacterium Pla86]